MLFLLILFLFTRAICLNLEDNVGSVLFHKRDNRKCWSKDDVSRLQARMIFENIILPSPSPDKISARYNREIITYFTKAIRSVECNRDRHCKQILIEALADTIGGHMRKEILPSARFAYYAGYVPYRSVRELHNFFDTVKVVLNTQGHGWRQPDKFLDKNLTVGKVLIGSGKPFDPCAELIIKRYSRNCIRIPTPLVDDEKRPLAIALPFKSGGFVSISAPSSENVLLKYYTTAARCILRKSPAECRHGDFVNFNNELWHWMKKYVAPHLMDEKLYAGYGGVLRIAAAVQNYGKGLSRRNIFDNDFKDLNRGNSWFASNIFQKKLYFDAGFMGSGYRMYICMILGVGVAVCCLHFLYSCICGVSGACRCAGPRIGPGPKEVGYANIDSNFPINPQSVMRCEESITKGDARSLHRSKSASKGTVRTHKVYDLNENMEKVMSIVMNDKELTESETSSSGDEEVFNQRTVEGTRGTPQPPRSPPKIDAPIAQLKIEKTPQKTPRIDNSAMYSTSTVTQSERSRFEPAASDSVWSESYSSEHSGSSLSTKSQSQDVSHRKIRTRDLAWAQRVMSKQKIRSNTDFSHASVVTSISRLK